MISLLTNYNGHVLMIDIKLWLNIHNLYWFDKKIYSSYYDEVKQNVK